MISVILREIRALGALRPVTLHWVVLTAGKLDIEEKCKKGIRKEIRKGKERYKRKILI